MAQTQEFDFEVVEKLRTVIDFGNDSVLAKLKTACDNDNTCRQGVAFTLQVKGVLWG